MGIFIKLNKQRQYVAVNQQHQFLSQAGMTTPKKEEVLAENLYEIPTCTICLQQLSEHIASLDCGHIFHMTCITQNFEYRGNCPLCQKRACLQEIRPVLFPLVQNSKANSQLHGILSALDGSQRKQVEHLLVEIKKTSAEVEKLSISLASCENDLTEKNKVIQGLKEDLARKRSEVEILRKENLKLEKNGQGLSEELNLKEKTEIRLRIELDKYKQHEGDYEKMKKHRRLMMENSEEFVKYKEQLEQRGGTPELMAKEFFDLLLMKNLQMLKLKDKIKEFPEKMADKEYEISKLKTTVETLRKELKESADRKTVERKKYDDLKLKYRQLSEKAKQKGLRENDIPEMEDSQGFGNLNKTISSMEEPMTQQTIRKPLFTSFSTIGGFGVKKKDDKLKFLA